MKTYSRSELSDKILMDFNEALPMSTGKSLENVRLSIPGLGWEDRLPLPRYSRLIKTNASQYLDHAWSLPALAAWLSIIQPDPNYAGIELLASKVHKPWAWQHDLDEALQPAVWAGAALMRDTRRKADSVLTNVLAQALEGAEDEQQRDQRAAAVLGGGIQYAIDLLADWDTAGWKATRTWGPTQIMLLEALLDPEQACTDRSNPWRVWKLATEALADGPAQAQRWQTMALQRAMISWIPLTTVGDQPHIGQETFSQSCIDHIQHLDPWNREPPKWPEDLLDTLKQISIHIVEQENNRGARRTQNGNIFVLSCLARTVLVQPSDDAAFWEQMVKLRAPEHDIYCPKEKHERDFFRSASLRHAMMTQTRQPSEAPAQDTEKHKPKL